MNDNKLADALDDEIGRDSLAPGSWKHQASTRLRLLAKICEALPNFDLEHPDAADFVDHSNDFATVMRLVHPPNNLP